MNYDQLKDILLSNKPSNLIKENEEEIFNLIPELYFTKGFDQKNKWHIYDVYDHTLNVIDNVPCCLSVRLAALFHDLGKPFTYTEDDNNVGHFYGHWDKSKEIFEEFSKKNNIDEEIKNLVSNLIFFHDKNLSKSSNDEIKEIVNILGLDGIVMLYELKQSDLLAQNSRFHYLLDELENQKKKILCNFKEN
jgi:tRNA nucleotidyltransferase (CCA-adding enzyme)